MATVDLPLPPEQLARRIEQDIHRRGLKYEDKYLSTRSLSSFFGVSLSAASQAMQDLAHKGILERRDRSGTFVGPKIGQGKGVEFKSIAILMPNRRADSLSLSLDAITRATRRRFPKTSVQVHFLPDAEELEYLRGLVSSPHASATHFVGAIPISCSRETYGYLRQMGIPQVVLGTPDPDQDELPHVDANNYDSGRLLAGYLLGRGRRHLAMLTPSGGQAGDHDFHEGILQAMADHGLPPNALTSRITSHEMSLFRAQSRAVLRREPFPSGVICRAESTLPAFLEVAAEFGLEPRRDIDIVYERALVSTTDYPLASAWTRSSETQGEIAERIADHLLSQCGNERETPKPWIIPMELITRDDA